ncbi:hypothetical protein IRJ41_006591 [Triplophysa rosa]|uniref:Uncharacterized protein n=1 Tax=Triplophysa rosa TaxID=992332 RepID=A0A9W7TFB4_TRIRA|nr:hypothetical protein IRJ41_006591 [Triplophysa rosa]
MYPVTVQRSLLVAFLLSLKGSYIHSADDICAPSRNPSLRYSVSENIPAALTEHQRQKNEEFDHKNDVRYCYVHFSKNDAHQPARVDDVQYAAVKVSVRSYITIE